jgi:hypothetical protein
VAQKDVQGAYDTQPLRNLEYLLHEVAHWLVLGHPIEKIPRRLSQKLNQQFKGIPAASSDNLEIDTAFVTFLTGYMLGLWTDPSPIVRCCRRNLKGPMALGDDSEVLTLFRNRWVSPSVYLNLARQLALWFRPSAKTKLLSCAFVSFGV